MTIDELVDNYTTEYRAEGNLLEARGRFKNLETLERDLPEGFLRIEGIEDGAMWVNSEEWCIIAQDSSFVSMYFYRTEPAYLAGLRITMLGSALGQITGEEDK